MAVELNNLKDKLSLKNMLITKQCCDPSQTNPLFNLEDCEKIKDERGDEIYIDKVFFRCNGCWTDVRDRNFEMYPYRQYISKR